MLLRQAYQSFHIEPTGIRVLMEETTTEAFISFNTSKIAAWQLVCEPITGHFRHLYPAWYLAVDMACISHALKTYASMPDPTYGKARLFPFLPPCAMQGRYSYGTGVVVWDGQILT
jgi:hypothetical protein